MPEEFPKPTENRWEKTEPGELPLPPEHPREEVYRALSVGGGILCLLLTAAIIVFLFYYANIEEQAAKESQKTAEAMRDNAERLIASLTEDLRQQQGKPVDAKFAGRISYDVSSYYGNPTDNGSSTQSGRNQGKLLSDVALLCKSQGLFEDAYSKYEQAFAICSKLAPNPQQDEEAWISSFNCLSGQGDVLLQQGKFENAEIKYKTSLERRALLRGNHSKAELETAYAQGLVNIADVNREKGYLDNAITYIEQGLQVEEDLVKKLESDLKSTSDAQTRSNIQNQIDDYTRHLTVFRRTRADLLRRLGHLPDGLSEIARVLKTLEDLQKRSTTNADPDIAMSLSVQGDIFRASGNLEDAARSYKMAHSTWEAIVLSDEYNLSTQSSLTDSLLNEGDAFLAENVPEESAPSTIAKAEAKYEEALKRLSEFHAETDSYGHQAKIALTHTKLGEVAMAQGEISAKLNGLKAREDFNDALMHFLKSEGLYEAWSGKGDNVFQAKCALAAVLCDEGDAHMKLNKLKEAREDYENSATIREWILEKAPQNVERQLDLAASKGNLAEALLRLSEGDEDQKTQERALALFEQSNQTYSDAHASLGNCVSFVEQEARSFYRKGLVQEYTHPQDATTSFENACGLLDPFKANKRLDRNGEKIWADADARRQKPHEANK
jgi:tetratricopeptide (TPR) repeat protein